MSYYQEALALQEETTAHRRYLHAHPELGFQLAETRVYVMDELRKSGIEPQECGGGITALIGNPGKVFLLRADMDALPIQEETGYDFCSLYPGRMHACGHDFHTSMLLTAAKLLKKHENELKGTVKLMFQPAEEITEGALRMINHGLLENPKVDAALGYHIWPGRNILPGYFSYNSKTPLMASTDMFQITVNGRGGHGAYPSKCIDPINIAVHIFTAFEALVAREADPNKTCVLTFGSFQGGNATNIIPDQVIMKGSLRTNDNDLRQLMCRRMRETAEGTAAMYGGTAEVMINSATGVLMCDHDLTENVVNYMKELDLPNMFAESGAVSNASEDFAEVSSRVPSVFINLGAGFTDERGDYPGHNARVQFNEDVLPVGAACMAHCAHRWLEDH